MWNLRYDSNIVTSIIWLTLVFLKHPVIVNKRTIEKSDIYSSVWCYSSDFGRRCSFNNLCYDPNVNSFLFILDKRTIMSGIKSRNDLKEISTSWLNHSHLYLKLALTDGIGEYKLIKNRVIIMSRFKPDNIMHVIHDDLLPLFVTYKRICLGKIEQCASETLIAFVDSFHNYFSQLYEAFTCEMPLTLQTVKSITCFSDAHIGLDSDSIFYQYGYTKPQGPVIPLIAGELFYEFTDYILKYLKIERIALVPRSTLIGRRINRKILNEKFLMELIKDLHFRKKGQIILVNNIDINTHTIGEVISSVASSKLLVGMHGAGMILAMFMPSGSIALELFPYGIVKEHVSALHSLSSVKDVHFGYLSWTNTNKENTLRHPEYPRLLGGFNEITDMQKKRITTATFVPAVQCCHDPLYLHFMYQDTYVDNTIIPVIAESFKIKKIINSKELMYKTWYFPSQVRNMECSFNDTHLMVTWDPPINVNNSSETYYKISLSWPERNSTYVTKSSFLCMKLPLKGKFVLVWVQCMINGIQGIDSYLICHI